MDDISQKVIHLSRLALSGRQQDIQMFLRQLAKGFRESKPDVAEEIEKLLKQSPTRSSPLRKDDIEVAVPVDADSRLHLVKIEHPVVLECDPIWVESIGSLLQQVVAEREREAELEREGLSPTKSLLFVGPPGVGKTLAARWIAHCTNRPLATLDLSAVMSSYLGRTGVNLRYVLDYAKSLDCVLLLDELDAMAKRRDDDSEIGELKRLVTVLLQEIDNWPTTGLLIAATNHPELLDPAAWRRFEAVLEFPMPNHAQVRQSIQRTLEPKGVSRDVIEVTATVFDGMSFSDIDRRIRQIQREAVIAGDTLESRFSDLAKEELHTMDIHHRKQAAVCLLSIGISGRGVHRWTGLHRSVIGELAKDI